MNAKSSQGLLNRVNCTAGKYKISRVSARGLLVGGLILAIAAGVACQSRPDAAGSPRRLSIVTGGPGRAWSTPGSLVCARRPRRLVHSVGGRHPRRVGEALPNTDVTAEVTAASV